MFVASVAMQSPTNATTSTNRPITLSAGIKG